MKALGRLTLIFIICVVTSTLGGGLWWLLGVPACLIVVAGFGADDTSLPPEPKDNKNDKDEEIKPSTESDFW